MKAREAQAVGSFDSYSQPSPAASGTERLHRAQLQGKHTQMEEAEARREDLSQLLPLKEGPTGN